MLPTIKALTEIEHGGSKSIQGNEERALSKVEAWHMQHGVRIALGAISFLAGIAALEIL